MKDDTALNELDYAVDILGRTIILDGDIEIEAPFFISSRIQKILNEESKDSITLRITSYGGDVLATLGVIDIMQTAPVKINTLGCGPVFSGAAFVLMSGTGIRQMTPNSYLMLHPITRLVEGTPSKIAIVSKFTQELETRCYEILQAATGKSRGDWCIIIGEQRYFSAEESLELGFIDSILKPEL